MIDKDVPVILNKTIEKPEVEYQETVKENEEGY